MTLPASSRSGKKTSTVSMPASISLWKPVSVSSWFASISTSPVDMSTTSAATICALHVVRSDFLDFRDALLGHFTEDGVGDLLALRHDRLALRVVDRVAELQADHALGLTFQNSFLSWMRMC